MVDCGNASRLLGVVFTPTLQFAPRARIALTALMPPQRLEISAYLIPTPHPISARLLGALKRLLSVNRYLP